jgi:hypothetical protein
MCLTQTGMSIGFNNFIGKGNPSFRCETRDLLTDYLILLLLVYQKAAKRTLSHLGHRQRQQ